MFTLDVECKLTPILPVSDREFEAREAEVASYDPELESPIL
jgi:hypothetical protein